MKKDIQLIKRTVFSVLIAGSVTLAGCSSSGDEPANPGNGGTTTATNDTETGSPDTNPNAVDLPTDAPPETDSTADTRFEGRTRGRVEQVNTNGSLAIMGQTVYISPTTLLVNITQNQIQVGDWLDINGQLDGNGNVYASSIDLDLDIDTTVRVTGLVSALDFVAGTLQIGGLTVAFGQLDFSNLGISTFTNGLVIELTADYGDFNSSSVSINAGGISVTQSDGTSVEVPVAASTPAVNIPTGTPDTGINPDTNSVPQTLSLSGISSCLTVGENVTFQVQPQSQALSAGPGIANLNALATVNAGGSDSVTVVSTGDAGVSITMTEQDIVALEISAGNASVTQYTGALDSTVQRPVILTRQTSNWCSYILFEINGCAAITNTSASASGITINNDGADLQGSARLTSRSRTLEAGAAVSTGSRITVENCVLDNPENIPLITIN